MEKNIPQLDKIEFQGEKNLKDQKAPYTVLKRNGPSTRNNIHELV